MKTILRYILNTLVREGIFILLEKWVILGILKKAA